MTRNSRVNSMKLTEIGAMIGMTELRRGSERDDEWSQY